MLGTEIVKVKLSFFHYLINLDASLHYVSWLTRVNYSKGPMYQNVFRPFLSCKKDGNFIQIIKTSLIDKFEGYCICGLMNPFNARLQIY